MTDEKPTVREIRVLGKTFTVEPVPAVEFLSDSFGRIDFKRSTIFYLESLTPDQIRETILHEVLHSVECAFGQTLKEREVCALSNGLYAVFRDNPDLVKFLMEE